MSTFKQKSLFATLAGLGVLGVVDSAQAVHVNADGLGQALVYPYYTARNSPSGNAYVTALSVVNTTASAKAVKVRFLEGQNSQEVLDFNLFLSQYDVWTAGIIANGTGAGLFTADNSCTTPKVSTNALAPTLFRNGAYAGLDAGSSSLDRTNEGYFEILEMGSIVDGSALQIAVTHVNNGSAPNASKPSCSTGSVPTGAAAPTSLVAPSGGLMGTASLLNINDGTDMSYDAIAFDGWSATVNWSSPGDTNPRLDAANPSISVVIDNTGNGGRVVRTVWGAVGVNARDAVSATIMRSHVYNEYTVESSIKAATDWVVTMPTKRFYVTGGGAAPPFQSGFSSKGSCDAINLTYYDREEQSPGAIIDFSPTTPESRSLCWEANVMTFSAPGSLPTASRVLGSVNMANVALGALFINGWADLSFPSFPAVPNPLTHTLVSPVGGTTTVDINNVSAGGGITSGRTMTYYGLPVVGFAVQSYSTQGVSTAPNILSNYGGNFNHKYLRTIQ